MFKYINAPEFYNECEELKSVYSKWRQRQFGKRLPVHIFGSGSEGNSVYLKPYRTLIDLGLPFKRYQEYSPTFFLDVDYVILTHHHGDHLNPSTLKRILKDYPHIKIIIHEFMWEVITSDSFKPEYLKHPKGTIVPAHMDQTYQTDADGNRIMLPSKLKAILQAKQTRFIPAVAQNLTTHDGRTFLFEPLTVKHGDIVNIAIQILDDSLDFNFLYASDLDNLGGARSFTDYQGRTQHITGLNQDREYTLMFLEANYDEDLLNQWYKTLDPNDPDYRRKKVRADGNLRHISEQEAFRYIERHLHNHGLFIPLHASRSFGTLYQD